MSDANGAPDLRLFGVDLDQPKPPECPSDERIIDYVTQHRSVPGADAIEEHIAGCDRCKVVLGQYEAVRDVEESVARMRRAMPRSRLSRSMIAFALIIAGGMLAGCGVFVVRHMMSRDLREFWKPFISSTSIVVGNARVTTIDNQVRNDYLGTGDALSVGAMWTILGDMASPPPQIHLYTSSELEAVGKKLDEPAVLIGGPTVNRFTLDALARARNVSPSDTTGLKQGFRFVTPKEIPENAFVRHTVNGAVGIEDVASGELLAIGPTAHDFALVVAMNLDGRPTVIVAGYGSIGTYQAIRAITRPTAALRQFHRTFAQHGYAEMLMRIDPDGEMHLAAFTKADNPR